MDRLTFAGDHDSIQAAIDALVAASFTFGPRRPVRRTLFDTFDGRLDAAGIRFECRDDREVVVTSAGSAAAHLRVSGPVRFATDLPPGPLRARLTGVLDVRALLPLVTAETVEQRAVRRDRRDKIVVTVQVNHEARVGTAPLGACVAIEPVAGFPKPAADASEVLRRCGLLACDDLMQRASAVAGVDPAGVNLSPGVALEPTVAAAVGYRAVLADLLHAVEANWAGTIDDIDTEFLHDLRVALRRTRSVLAQSEGVLPPDVLARAKDEFAWLARSTSAARDADTALLEWPVASRSLGTSMSVALAPVGVLLEQHRQRAHDEVVLSLESTRARELVTWWRQWLVTGDARDEPAEPAEPADASVAEVVAARLVRAQKRLLRRGRRIDDASPPEALHDLRKDAKRLRYLLECFGGLLPAGPNKVFVRRLKALQTNLGEHQDAEVWVALLHTLAAELDTAVTGVDTLVAVGQLTERLDARRRDARAEFAERFADYDTAATATAFDELVGGLRG